MLKKKMNRLMNKCDVWRLIRIALAGGIITSATALVLELVMPLRLNNDTADTSTINTVAANDLPKILQPRHTGIHEVAKIIRAGLFKSETPLRDKPMADKTIERIKSQLELQCIMELNGEPVAYVNIKGIGMKKCKIGDSVSDLFTVLNIGKKSIEITIVGHREILSL
jgi:hypothetical protein